MTIRRMCDITGLEVDMPPPEDERIRGDVSLVFAIDEGFLEPLKVTLTSLARGGSFPDAPLVVYTASEAVARDPVLSGAADRLVTIPPERLDVLEDLSRTSVRTRDRAAWNQGTFLKWAAFEPQETRQALFLDGDVIVPRRLGWADFAGYEDTAFAYVPQFQKTMMETFDGARMTDERRAAELRDALAGRYRRDVKSRVNSGVMVLGGQVLDDAFFRAITAFSAGSVRINEQSHMSAFFLENPGLAEAMPAAFNFQEHYARDLPMRWLDDVYDAARVIHFTGHPKPWAQSPSGVAHRPAIALWHWYRSMAAPVLAYRG